MEEGKVNLQEHSKFNMAQLILNNINKHLILSADYYSQGKLDKQFYELENAYGFIKGKLDEKERDEMTKLAKEVHIILPKRIFQRFVPLIYKKINDYSDKIQTHIEKKRIGLVSKTDESIFT